MYELIPQGEIEAEGAASTSGFGRSLALSTGEFRLHNGGATKGRFN